MASDSVDDDIVVNDDFDVVIVGAGLTGLTAAYSILKRRVGLRILILEKNDDVGGRILLENNSQAYHASSRQKHIKNLATELEIPMEKGRDERRLEFFTNDGPFVQETSGLVSGEIYHFVKLLQDLSTDSRCEDHENREKLAEMSIDEFMTKIVYFSKSRSLCRSLLYVCCGVENLTKVSALWFATMLRSAGGFLSKLSASLGDEERFFLKGGFDFLVEKLKTTIVEQGGIISCSKTVVKIVNEGERIFVFTPTITFKCDYVVIAVPPPSSAFINQKPNFSESFLKSQTLYESGKNVFFHATYKTSSWPGNSSGCMITTDNSGTILRMTYEATHPSNKKIRTLAGFTTKPVNDASARTSIFGALNKCYRTRKSTRCIDYKIGDRLNDDVASPMSVLRPSSLKYHVNPMILPLERIIFAASEYAMKWPGTADGAIEAGESATCSIFFQARPQALDRDEIIEYTNARRKFEVAKPSGIFKAHLLCLGLNVSLFFFLLRDAYGRT